jgi:NAD(P)-dependent dehydrogenase (short-subunit alcohol dehydrogenase family)
MTQQRTAARRLASDGAVLVTGAGGGIGTAACRALAARGLTVYAGARDPRGATALGGVAGVRVIELDVTSPGSAAGAARLIEAGGVPLRGVVNNAGLIVQGPLELLPLEELRREFEVNTFGPQIVTQALLPLLRQASGRVINISAPTARLPGPFFGPISASKAALEALSHAQRVELAPWGIHVVLIEPGATATPIFTKASDAARTVTESLPPERAALYAGQLAAVEKAFGAMRQGRPEAVAKVITAALLASRPRPLYTVGADARPIGLLARLPLRTRDRLLARVTGLARVTPPGA